MHIAKYSKGTKWYHVSMLLFSFSNPFNTSLSPHSYPAPQTTTESSFFALHKGKRSISSILLGELISIDKALICKCWEPGVLYD